MSMIVHVFRRGSVYTWRRRVPIRSGNATKASYIQASLHTHDRAKARVIGAVLNATSERAFEMTAASRLTAEQGRTWLDDAWHLSPACVQNAEKSLKTSRINVMRLVYKPRPDSSGSDACLQHRNRPQDGPGTA